MTTSNTSSRYTYTTFAAEVIGICKGEVELTDAVRARVADKAAALLAAQETRAAYNATHPKKSTAKGASPDTAARAANIKTVLSIDVPMTAADINAALATDYTALQVANACKFIPGVTTCKVIRSTVNSKGLRADKEYTAYALT